MQFSGAQHEAEHIEAIWVGKGDDCYVLYDLRVRIEVEALPLD